MSEIEAQTPPATSAVEEPKKDKKDKKVDWVTEVRGLAWLVLAVLAFWSFVAKPFYIPSESMMPTLIKGDRLVVSKFPYGWSYASSFWHVLPFMHGRLLGHMPERGDVVILTPPGESSDYIKRVIGLPGDTIEVREGALWLNGKPVQRVAEKPAMIPVDANVPCDRGFEAAHRVTGPDGKLYCALPVFRETLPSGRTYDTIDLGVDASPGDEYGPITVPAGHVFVMGDNRDESADSRYPVEEQGLGGPIPWENLGGRAEFITHSYDGTGEIWNPISWFTALRPHRTGINLHPARVAPAEILMSDTPDDAKAEPIEGRAPLEMRDPRMRAELTKAIIWVSVVLSVVLLYVLAQPLLLIVGGLVFASMLDGGARLLGRILPVPRGWRVALVAILALAFLLGVASYAGLTLIGQFQALKDLVMNQVTRVEGWANARGIMPKGGPDVGAIGKQLMGSLGQLTSAVGVALGGISSLAMIVVLGLFFAAEPRMYERGFAWLLPADKREGFFETSADMARTLRRLMAGRLLGMAAEGLFIWIALSIVGVPFALLLGLITGILAFLPNIGAIVSGVLTVLVGFSAGSTTGFLAIGVYVLVQVFDGYVVVPTVARRSVDLAPALVLGMQLLLGALFGLLGLMFADPIVAMAKVALERKSGLDPAVEAKKEAK